MKKNFSSRIATTFLASVIGLGCGSFNAMNINASNKVNPDINNDGLFNCADVLIMKNQMLGNCIISSLHNLDINNDGIFNILDFIALKEELVSGTNGGITYTDKWEKSLVAYENLKAKSTSENSESHVYSANDLLSSIDYYSSVNFHTTIDFLNEKFPIEKLYTSENSVPYCIYQLEDGKKMYVFFEDKYDTLHMVIAVFIVDNALNSKDFYNLENGMTLADVEKLDPGIQILDELGNYPLGKCQTLHMTDDGFVKITYQVGESQYYENFYVESQYMKEGTANGGVPVNSEDFVIRSVEFIPNGEEVSIYCQEEFQNFRFTIIDNIG